MDFGKNVFRSIQRLLKIGVFTLLVLLTNFTVAQVPVAIATGGLPVSAHSMQLLEETGYPKVSANLLVGMSALPGLEVALQPSADFNVRLSYCHFRLDFADLRLDPATFGFTEGPELKINAGVHLSTINLIAEYMPLESDWFRLGAGAAIGLNNAISGRFELNESILLNDLELTPEEVGYVEGIYYTDLPIYPYLGIGLGRIVPKYLLSFSADIGTYYRPAPRFEVNSSELIEENDSNEAVLEANFMKWRWQPTLNLRLGVRIL
ncbi:MAG: hypothetical protein KDC44_09770 [Phaeodactylibacter sp.]|nr:hypothetical protein [Phaeodactylibacter sp.]